jgi:hypothetical protein
MPRAQIDLPQNDRKCIPLVRAKLVGGGRVECSGDFPMPSPPGDKPATKHGEQAGHARAWRLGQGLRRPQIGKPLSCTLMAGSKRHEWGEGPQSPNSTTRPPMSPRSLMPDARMRCVNGIHLCMLLEDVASFHVVLRDATHGRRVGAMIRVQPRQRRRIERRVGAVEEAGG